MKANAKNLIHTSILSPMFNKLFASCSESQSLSDGNVSLCVQVRVLRLSVCHGFYLTLVTVYPAVQQLTTSTMDFRLNISTFLLHHDVSVNVI